MATDSPTLTSEIIADLESLGSSFASALEPITGAETALSEAAKAIQAVSALLSSTLAAHQTPAMISAKEAQDEQAEKDEDNAAVAKAEAGDLTELRERSS